MITIINNNNNKRCVLNHMDLKGYLRAALLIFPCLIINSPIIGCFFILFLFLK